MFWNIFSKNKKPTAAPENSGISYSFIWYKKMQVGNTTYYTQPFRTKIRGANKEEARIKCMNFAMNKLQLVVIDEDRFSDSEISKLQQEFEKLNEHFKNIIDNIHKNQLKNYGR